MDIILKKKWRC